MLLSSPAGMGGTCPQALSRSAGSNPTCSTRPRSPARRASLDSHEAHSIGRRRIVSTDGAIRELLASEECEVRVSG
jgi:hypothetical protein